MDEVFAKELDTKTNLVKEDGLPSDDFIDTTGEGTITIRPGINTITVTNTAMGQLEICKARIQYLDDRALRDAAQPWFNFVVDGKTKVQVRAGRCCTAASRLGRQPHGCRVELQEAGLGDQPVRRPAASTIIRSARPLRTTSSIRAAC